LEPPSSNYGSPLDLDYPIVPAHLDHLTVDTRWPKDSSDDSFVELESVGGDQRGGLKIHSIREVAKQVLCVVVASFADYARRPQPGPDVDHNEDPDRLLLAPHDGSDLVGLKFYDGKSVYFQIIEPTTAGGCPLQPAMNSVPADSVDSSNGRLVEAFDTEGGDSIKRGAAVLESIIRRASRRGKGLPTSLTLVPTTLSPPRRVEAVADDGPDVALFRGRAVLLGTAETLHGW